MVELKNGRPFLIGAVGGAVVVAVCGLLRWVF